MIYPFRSRRYLRSYQTIFLFICTLSCCHSLSTTRLHRRTLFKAITGAEHAGDLAKGGKQVHETVTDSKTVFSGGHVNLPKFHERLPTIPEHPAPLPNKPPPTHFLPPKSEHSPNHNLDHVPSDPEITEEHVTLAELFAQEREVEEKQLLAQKEIIELAKTKKGISKNSGDRWSEILKQLKTKSAEAFNWVKQLQSIKRQILTLLRKPGRYGFEDGIKQLGRALAGRFNVDLPKKKSLSLEGTIDYLVPASEKSISVEERKNMKQLLTLLEQKDMDIEERKDIKQLLTLLQQKEKDSEERKNMKQLLTLLEQKDMDIEEWKDIKQLLTLLQQKEKDSEERKNMKQLLTLLQQKEKDIEDIETVTKQWKLLQNRFYPTSTERIQFEKVQDFLKERKSFSEELTRENEAAIKSMIQQENWQLPFQPDFYMKNYFDKSAEEKYYLLLDFVRGRAIQIYSNPPKNMDPLLNVVQRLPKDADLESEFFRFTMLRNFEEILRKFHQESDDEITQNLRGRFLHDPIISSLPESLESLFASTAKEDIEWREDLFVNAHQDRLTPSEMFAKLQGQTDDAGRINYAFCRNPDSLSFLSDEEKRALRSTLNRREFRKKSHELEAKYSKPEQIKAFKEFEKQAIHSDPVNHPYAEELFQKGLIDQATRDKLNPLNPDPLNKLTQSKFSELLGPSEEFKTLVVTQFKKNLLEEMKTANPQQIEKNMVLVASKFSLALRDRLIAETTTDYLTPKALLEPHSVNFIEVLKDFSNKLDRLDESHIDPTQLTKAYVEAQFHLGRIEPPEVTPWSEFFDAMKIQTDPSYSEFYRKAVEGTKGTIFSKLDGFDPRMWVLAERPLENGDARLRGTKFERLTQQDIAGMNSFAHYLFNNIPQFDRAIARNEKAEGKINSLISSFSEEQVKQITPRINRILETRKLPPEEASHIFTEEDLKRKNHAVWLWRMQRVRGTIPPERFNWWKWLLSFFKTKKTKKPT